MTVQNVGNPFPVLRRLCEPDGWAVYEAGPGLPMLDLKQNLPANAAIGEMPEENMVTREYVAAVLRRWHAGELTPQQVQQWAGGIFYNFELQYADWEGEHSESVTADVVGALALLGLNRITAADVGMYLAFLETPVGSYEDGRRILDSAKERIDYARRTRELRGIWPCDVLAKRY